MGVRRAVEMTAAAIFTAAENASGVTPLIYTLGPLIHNPQVLASLAERGVKILEDEELFTCSKKTLTGIPVIIRAHGVSPVVEQMLREQGANIIDATCPRVKASQNEALELAEKGYVVFLAGEKDHAEIKGLYGYVMVGAAKSAGNQKKSVFQKTSCVIIGGPCEAKQRARELKNAAAGLKNFPVKTALIGQTTISKDEYLAVADAIKGYFPQLEVKKTICSATRERQDALRDLCDNVDAVIIAGGKESANTRRLFAIAKKCGKPAWLVESAAELPEVVTDPPLLIQNNKTIGLSAGASTPDSVIDEIEQALV